MKLPALWLAAALAAGIALAGLIPYSPLPLLAIIVVVLAGGFIFAARDALVPAWLFVLAAWTLLGAIAAQLEPLRLPENHITRLLAKSSREKLRDALSEPLRWQGILRSDPVRLPWGVRYEIELEEVEARGKRLSVSGGLRIQSYFDPAEEGAGAELPAVRAGDRIEALVRARLIRNYGNPGSFDARTYFNRIGVHLTATLRSPELLQRRESPPPTIAHRFARLRGVLLERVDRMFAGEPQPAAVARAMLLGDRSFIDHELAETFQRTSAYHVLVISGLHVAALAMLVWWLATQFRLGQVAATLVTLGVLGFFVAIVEDRPPIERAALMASLFLISRLLFRRAELLNTIAVAALVLLVARPSSLADPSFQLSFLAAGMIGALGLPWVEQTSAPYRRALDHLSDATRDDAHPPRAVQFRLDLRAAAGWLAEKLPRPVAQCAGLLVTLPFRVIFRLWEVLVITAAIQLGMLGPMALYFHRVNPAGPLVNVPASLIAGLTVPVGFLMLGLSAVWPALGTFAHDVLGAMLEALVGVVQRFARWEWASYRIPDPPVWVLAGLLAGIVLLAVAAHARLKKENPLPRQWQWAAALPLAVFTALVATHPFPPELVRGALEVTVLDVGQGDAIFVATPEGRTLLVDAGGIYSMRRGGYRTGFDVGEQVVSPYLWSRGLKRVDAVALTHAHQDHIDGIHAVLDNFAVGELWVGREVEHPAFQQLLEHAAAYGVPIVRRTRGDAFGWGGTTVMVLWPEESTPAMAASNNDSLVLRIEHGRHAFLLGGDIERDVEQELVLREDPLDADFLKVPHHGSRTSANPEFVTAVTPEIAVLSFGANNPFGHPHAEVLAELSRPGLQVYRTDRDGAVTVLSDGSTLRARAYWAAGRCD